MDTAHIREFLELTRKCNFQEAAYELHMSQSTLSKHIKMLENELGNPLFDRTTRSVELNAYGTLFLDFANSFQTLHDEFESAANRLRLSDNQRLAIAYSPALGPYQVIETISQFADKNKEITVSLIEDQNPMALLHSHICNFAVDICDEDLSDSIEKMSFKSDYLVVALPENHPLASKPFLTIEEIIEEPFVSYTDRLGDFNRFLDICQKSSYRPRLISKTIFRTNAIKMIGHGNCISVMNSRQLTGTEHCGVKAVRLEPLVNCDISILRRKDHKKTDSEIAFQRFVSEI